jgi:hypothetical protein
MESKLAVLSKRKKKKKIKSETFKGTINFKKYQIRTSSSSFNLIMYLTCFYEIFGIIRYKKVLLSPLLNNYQYLKISKNFIILLVTYRISSFKKIKKKKKVYGLEKIKNRHCTIEILIKIGEKMNLLSQKNMTKYQNENEKVSFP